jgi:hypothetical protein
MSRDDGSAWVSFSTHPCCLLPDTLVLSNDTNSTIVALSLSSQAGALWSTMLPPPYAAAIRTAISPDNHDVWVSLGAPPLP